MNTFPKSSAYLFLLVAMYSLSACSKGNNESLYTESNNQNLSAPVSNARSSNNIRVMAFNILAPCWADPVYYPTSSAPFLNRTARRQIIIDFLKGYQNTVDVFALQEVAQVEFNFIKDALKLTHVGLQANHDPSYWSNWVTAATPWELNGNAIFVKKDRFTNIVFEDFPSSASGNHSALFTGTIRNSGGKILRVASVHLDSDYAYNRKSEMGAVLAKWKAQNNTTEIIAGDFNTETDATNIQADIQKAGYYDVLEILGTAGQTHPWDSKYNGADNWGIIDHIISRRSTPVDGSVMNFNLFNLYPNDEEMRINKNLQLSGSDHFPIMGTISY